MGIISEIMRKKKDVTTRSNVLSIKCPDSQENKEMLLRLLVGDNEEELGGFQYRPYYTEKVGRKSENVKEELFDIMEVGDVKSIMQLRRRFKACYDNDFSVYKLNSNTELLPDEIDSVIGLKYPLISVIIELNIMHKNLVQIEDLSVLGIYVLMRGPRLHNGRQITRIVGRCIIGNNEVEKELVRGDLPLRELIQFINSDKLDKGTAIWDSKRDMVTYTK